MTTVPLIQSFRFRPINTARPNFDNTFAADTKSFPYEYAHYVPEQEITFQVITPDDNETYSVCYLVHDGTSTLLTDIATSFIGVYKYETYTVDFSLYADECCYIEVYERVLTDPEELKYRTERFKVKTMADYLTIEWFSFDNTIMDYSTGLTHILQLDARQWKMQPAGESTVYSNQGRETKLKGITNRIFLLELELPVYLADILAGATDHDQFFVNEVEFVVSKKPTFTQLGTSDMYAFSCELQQTVIVGLNTHDVGI